MRDVNSGSAGVLKTLRAQFPSLTFGVRLAAGGGVAAGGVGVPAGGVASGVAGPASAMRPSVGGGVPAVAAAGVGAGVAAVAVVVVDQAVMAGVGFSAGTTAVVTGAAPFLAARASMAVGTQRPVSLSPWPAGQGLPQTLS